MTTKERVQAVCMKAHRVRMARGPAWGVWTLDGAKYTGKVFLMRCYYGSGMLMSLF